MIKRLKAKKVGKISVWAIAIAVNVFVAAGLVVSAYGGLVNPDTTALGAIAAMTFPFWLIAMLLILAVNFFLFRRLAVFDIITLIMCAGPIYTYCPVNASFMKKTEPADSTLSFSLLTYNCYVFNTYGEQKYNGEEPNKTISYIIKKDADIVCLQESDVLDPLKRWRFYRPQIDSLLTMYPYRLTSLKTGLSILSKFPVDSISVPKKGFNASVTADFKCYRVWLQARKLYIFNVHLQSIGLTAEDKKLYYSLTSRDSLNREAIDRAREQLLSKLSAAYRLRAIQARELAERVEEITDGRPVIVCGDFNDVPGCYATRIVRGDEMRDAFADAGNGPSITYRANRFYFRIDHIFYGGPLQPISVERDKINTSDHYPLFATFEWTNVVNRR